MIGRREAMIGAVAGAALLGGSAEACSLTATLVPVSFSDAACRRSIAEWVALLNEGPNLPLAEVAERAERMPVTLDEMMVNEAVGPTDGSNAGIDRGHLFYRAFRVLDGHPDPRPIRVFEINLIRRLRNRATYQFTLERYAYHAADMDGCNGMFPTHPEYYGIERTSYLATFVNNRLNRVKAFPEWYLERVT